MGNTFFIKRSRVVGVSHGHSNIKTRMYDLFTGDVTTGSVNGSKATDQVASRTVTDTENKLAVVDGRLVVSGGKAVPAWNDPKIYFPSPTERIAGRSVFQIVNANEKAGNRLVGFDSASFYFAGDGMYPVIGAAMGFIGDYNPNTDYRIGMSARAKGMFWMIKGGAYTEWTLLWIDADTTAILPIMALSYTGGFTLDNLKVVDLPAPFNSDYGLATDHLVGSINSLTPFDCEADAIIEYVVTTVGAGNAVRFRQDVDINGATYYLETQLDGRPWIWEYIPNPEGWIKRADLGEPGTVKDGSRIVIVQVGSTIKAYIDNVLAGTFEGATRITQTGGSVYLRGAGSVVSDLISWPRHLSGAALLALNKVSPAIETNVPITLMKDEFKTDRAAGAVNGTVVEPGPGVRTVTDTEGKLSIAGGKLKFAQGKAVPAWGDPQIYYSGPYSRIPGRALTISVENISDGYEWAFGYAPLPNAGESATAGIAVYDDGTGNTQDGGAWIAFAPIGTYVYPANYSFVSVLRTAGHFLIEKVGSDYKIVWIGNADTTTNLYPSIMNRHGVRNFSSYKVVDLPAPFNTDYGLATQRLAGARQANDTFIHEADAIIEFAVTTMPDAGKAAAVCFRVQDDRNRWDVDPKDDGSIDLLDEVDGSWTVRGNAAVGSFAQGHRLVIVCEGETIKVYANNVLKITYASASNFKTATRGYIYPSASGVISDLVAWPKKLSGAALDALNKA